MARIYYGGVSFGWCVIDIATNKVVCANIDTHKNAEISRDNYINKYYGVG